MPKDRELNELLAKQALHELVTRVSCGVDRCDPDIIRSCYHPDAIDDHGHLTGDVEVFIEYVMRELKGRPFLHHRVTNELFEIHGDHAYGEVYISMESADEEGEPQTGSARYCDRYDRRDGEWRISRRMVVLDKFPKTGFADGPFKRGRQDHDDPSYALFSGRLY